MPRRHLRAVDVPACRPRPLPQRLGELEAQLRRAGRRGLLPGHAGRPGRRPRDLGAAALARPVGAGDVRRPGRVGAQQVQQRDLPGRCLAGGGAHRAARPRRHQLGDRPGPVPRVAAGAGGRGLRRGRRGVPPASGADADHRGDRLGQPSPAPVAGHQVGDVHRAQRGQLLPHPRVGRAQPGRPLPAAVQRRDEAADSGRADPVRVVLHGQRAAGPDPVQQAPGRRLPGGAHRAARPLQQGRDPAVQPGPARGRVRGEHRRCGRRAQAGARRGIRVVPGDHLDRQLRSRGQPVGQHGGDHGGRGRWCAGDEPAGVRDAQPRPGPEGLEDVDRARLVDPTVPVLALGGPPVPGRAAGDQAGGQQPEQVRHLAVDRGADRARAPGPFRRPVRVHPQVPDDQVEQGPGQPRGRGALLEQGTGVWCAQPAGGQQTLLEGLVGVGLGLVEEEPAPGLLVRDPARGAARLDAVGPPPQEGHRAVSRLRLRHPQCGEQVQPAAPVQLPARQPAGRASRPGVEGGDGTGPAGPSGQPGGEPGGRLPPSPRHHRPLRPVERRRRASGGVRTARRGPRAGGARPVSTSRPDRAVSGPVRQLVGSLPRGPAGGSSGHDGRR